MPLAKSAICESAWELQWQGPYIYCVPKVTFLTVSDLDPCTQLTVTERLKYSRWKDAPHHETMIPGEIRLQASWICSLTSSSSTGSKITTWKFRVWHEQDRHWCYRHSVYRPGCASKHSEASSTEEGIINSSLNPVIFLSGRSGEVCVICFEGGVRR